MIKFDEQKQLDSVAGALAIRKEIEGIAADVAGRGYKNICYLGIGGTYAVMPELYLAMNDHINKGEIKEAQAIQYDADRIIYKMCEAHGNLYAVQKEILRRMYGLELGGVREPMPGLIPEDEPIVAEAQAMIEAAIAKL